MHMVNTYLETLQECQSRRRIGWIIQNFRETCVSHSLIFSLETKIPWHQIPSRKEKAVMFTNVTADAYQSQLNAGFLKVCEIFKVRGIKYLKYIQEFNTPVCYCGDFPRPETWCRTKRSVIGCLTCRSNCLMGGPWPMNAAIYSRPSAVSLMALFHCMVRFGTARYGTVWLSSGQFAFPLQFSTALEWDFFFYI